MGPDDSIKTMKKIEESFTREYEAQEYDVIVVGGGVAGISAALAAVRNGAESVLLIEKQYVLGGLATLGLVTIYLPLCDGKGRQVSFGIAEELLRLSISLGAENDYPDAWMEKGREERRVNQRFEVQFPASVFAMLAERLLRKERVEILYGTAVCGAQVRDEQVKALFVENKSGRSAVCAGAYVDATGDADLCALCGEKTAMSQKGNTLAGWYYLLSAGKNQLRKLGFAEDMERRGNADKKHYGGLEAREVSNMMQDAHEIILKEYEKRVGETASEGEWPQITAISGIPQVRMTRRLAGLTEADLDTEMRYRDAIGVIGNWRKAGPSYELPFRALYGGRIKNLLAAGRCISVTERMWDISRAIPACAVTGEAAGTAAALCKNYDGLDILTLQIQLRKNGGKPSKEEL